MKKIQLKISTSQTIMYAVGRRGWNNFISNLAAFTAFSAKYTKDYGVAALAQLEAAAKLPNADQRRSNTKSLNRKTKNAATDALKLWKKISRYIVNAYDDDQVEPMREAAGSNYYAMAAEGNFNDTFTLMGMELTFITANADTLAQGGQGMPDTFTGTFTASKDAFDNSLSQYNAAITNSEQDTSAKVTANETVFKMLMDMLNDGKEIFEGNDTLVKQFTYAALERLEDKNHNTGLHFIIKEAGSEDSIGNSTLTFYPQNVEGKANKKGTAMVTLKEGIVNCTINTPNYETVELTNLQVDKDVMHRHKVLLKKITATGIA